jgi:phosphonoacetate hydrolase
MSMADEVLVNGRRYQPPRQPTAVVCIDGGAPAYLDDALERGLMPCLAQMLNAGGAYQVGLGEMPSLTNPNNLSIVTGASPLVHGVPGNHYLDPESRQEVQLTDPSFLRASSIHAQLQQAGVAVLCVTAKDKLRRLLADGGVPSISAERAHELSLPQFGVDDLTELIGARNPGIYDWDLSAYAMRLGLAVHRRVSGGLRLLYVSLTDYVQHKQGPGGELSDRFLRELDRQLGAYLEAGFRVGITADHGMSAKHDSSGAPRVHYLSDVLESIGAPDFHVVLPITDPYVVHHGALGSFAWVHVPESYVERAREAFAALDGIEEVLSREEAAVIYQHPADRIGDLSVASDARTALGSSRARHDLSHVAEGLRSHGGRHEQLVPIIVSHPLREPYATQLRQGARNRDLHDLVLNGLA